MGIEGLDGFYELKKTVGSGGFAKVKLAIHILTGEKVAIKMMEKSALGDDIHRVQLELEALKGMDHPNICKLYEVIETETHFFLVIEYCSRGELFDRIVECKRLSEKESREYFRQIVSAVAHIHSLGFVHRDLKPENILLDRDGNLKLIDFGLCARPTGGIKCFLDTSCGSPSYAAPELVLGKKYHGTEVDVWSLGVLLYALLCGSLPFDDAQLQKLYSKILSGKYEEPEWLSGGSKMLIRQMLQTDPARRITVKQLLTHPWMLAGGKGPVNGLSSQTPSRARDTACLSTLAVYHGLSAPAMWARVSTWRYDHDTATYLLLVGMKRRGRAPCIVTPPRMLFRARAEANLRQALFDKPTRVLSPNNKTYTVIEAKKPAAVEPVDEGKSDKENVVSPRRRSKRHHSPEPSPAVPAKMATPVADRLKENAATIKSPVTPRMESPRGSARKMFERGLNRVRHVLTPRRRTQAESSPASPAVFSPKGLCNVSTTSSKDPDLILSQLREALICKGISVSGKGYTLRGKLETDIGHARSKVCKLTFELEVCLIQLTESDQVVGIRRKRLKGDAWCYRKVCEEVLALAACQPPRQSTLV